ncbi:MAG: zinc ribbon domain-containing protein [Thermoplasmata archaeon]|nr:zinc ribbon domain-containing protein [Thermoplasmata archaeon]
MEGDKFCTRCGAMLPDGAAFCPDCGANIDGSAPAGHGYGEGYGYQPAPRVPWFMVLVILYGVLATIGGLMAGCTYAAMDEAYYNDMIQMMSDMTGMDYSTLLPAWSDSMHILMTVSMFAIGASGIAAIASYVLFKRGDVQKSIILCGAASVLTLVVCAVSPFEGIAMFVIGAVITYMLYSARDTLV